MSTENSKPLTVNDFIHSDPRIIELKKEYNDCISKKNQFILDVARAEADIIYTMGAFEYLNNFKDTEDAHVELLAKFNPLILIKSKLIQDISDMDKKMEETTGRFEALANAIVEELKKKADELIKAKTENEPPKPEDNKTCECVGDDCPNTEVEN